MRHIQDEKIDQLFREQFDHAEMTPPAGLWLKINQDLEVKAVRKKAPFYWMAAAAAIALTTVGLLFSKQEKIQLHGTDTVIAKGKIKVKTVPVQKTDPSVVQIQAIAPVEAVVSKKPVAPVLEPALADNLKNEVKLVQVSQSEPQLNMVMERPAPVVMASIHPLVSAPDEVTNENDQTEKRGIRNMGDLINYVVDKVDKREQKILRFNTDDDDNSSLVAINIGFIKFNSKKHK